MLKIFITSLICTLMLFCTNVSAADFQAGDTAYVKAGIESMSVYQNPSYGRSVAVVIQYNKVTILEPNVVGDGGTFHKIQLQDGTIGYDPPFAEKSRTEANANTAFYVGASSEFDVVAYNENWVAVWSEGGVDESRGSIIDCSGRKDGGAFTSWKPGVYFLPRKNCYILDIKIKWQLLQKLKLSARQPLI